MLEVEVSELEPVYFVRIGKARKFKDDYGFEFGGQMYYVNKQVKESGNWLLFKVLDALNEERAKVEKLERKVSELKLKIKAAKYEGIAEYQRLIKNNPT